MKDKNNQDLFIKKLAQDLKPINVNWSPERRFFLWTILNLLITSIIMYQIGEFSIFNQLSGYRIIDFIIGACAILFMGYFSFIGIVPGAIKTKNLKLAGIPFILLVLTFFYFMAFDKQVIGMGKMRAYCDFEIFGLALIPSAQISYFLFKDYLTANKFSVLIAGTSSCLIPAFLMNYICYPNHLHIIKNHLLPTLGFGLLFYFFIFHFIKLKKAKLKE